MADTHHDTSHPDALRRVREAVLDQDRLVRAVLAGRREEPRKVEIRPVRLRAGPRVQLNSFAERRSHTRNLPTARFAAEVDALLAMGWRTIHVATTTSTITVRVGKRGKVFLHEAPAFRAVDDAHDRAERRLLSSDAQFLRVLGVAGPDGRIHADKQAKYRQIDKFLRLLQDAAPLTALPRPIRIADLGCGNADLTFATYHHVNRTLGMSADVIGVDVNEEAVARNNARARELGWTGLRFVAGRILRYEPATSPHVVLALHACDTATDEALARAVAWRCQLVLAAPCCHHDLQAQLSSSAAPDGFAPLLRHGLLLQRFGDLLTDALRASVITMHGYRTDVFQFVATEHTARNVMIRAVRTGARASASEAAAYRTFRDQWHVTPKLEQLLRLLLAGGPST